MTEIQLYLGDCLDILPTLEAGSVDAVITDPPYPDAHTDKWEYVPLDILDEFTCRQLVFWSATADFPLDWTAIHIWAKAGTGVGRMYERIFERNGGRACLVFRAQILNNHFNARIGKDVFYGHPAQKPIALMQALVERYTRPGDVVLDSFMGSGTTGVACVKTGRNFIGIDNDPGSYAIAEKRIAEAQMQPRLEGI